MNHFIVDFLREIPAVDKTLTMLAVDTYLDTVHCKSYNLGHQSVVPPRNGTGWTLRGQVRVRATSESCFPPGVFKDLYEWFTESSKGCPTLSKSSAAVAYPRTSRLVKSMAGSG